MQIAALIPTYYRPDGLRRVLTSLHQTAPDVVPVVACERDDEEAGRIAINYRNTIVTVCREYRQGCAYAWNEALRAAPDFDAYVIASDDVEFRPGWLTAAMKGIKKNYGFIGLYAHWKVTWYSFFYMMTRQFIQKYHGGVAAVPHYKVWGVDTEACDRAIRVGQYYKTPEWCVVHHHAGNPPEAQRIITKQIYNARKAADFPNDFERII